MKLAPATYQPATNWMTVALLTVVMLGFGVFAEARMQANTSATSTAVVTELNQETKS